MILPQSTNENFVSTRKCEASVWNRSVGWTGARAIGPRGSSGPWLFFGLVAHPRDDLIVPLGEDGRVANEGVTEHRLPVRDDLLARPQGVLVI
jgi:hypothetical protein